MKAATTIERRSDHEIVVERQFQGPAHNVFRAWSDPELFKQWWVPPSFGMTFESCEADVRTGGTYRFVFRHPAFDQPMVFFGRYTEVTPPSRLVWTNEESAEVVITTVTFEEQAGTTRLTMRERYPSKQALDEALANGSSGTGAATSQFELLDEVLVAIGAPRTKAKVTPFLMFNDQLEAAITFYTATFPDSTITTAARVGNDGPIMSAEFVVGGQRFMGYNGGAYFQFSQGFSLFVHCEDQAEVDRYWDAFVSAGATPLQCGWITDPFGLTWQIVPKRFMELIADTNKSKVTAVMDAMMQMVKLDVAALEQAYDSTG